MFVMQTVFDRMCAVWEWCTLSGPRTPPIPRSSLVNISYTELPKSCKIQAIKTRNKKQTDLMNCNKYIGLRYLQHM